MTAALFADSGWYYVNSSLAEPMPWGNGAGCDFVQKSCDAWRGRGYRCSHASQTACSYDRRAKAYCDVRHYSTALPLAMRHMESAYQGGFSELLDYCPVYRPYQDGQCAKDETYRAPSSSWEERCPSCRCIETTAVDYALWDRDLGTACHRTRCLNSSSLEIKLGTRWRSCPPEGGAVTLSPLYDGRSGSVMCPPAAEICHVEGALWPVLSTIAPHSGPVAGGQPLTLTGLRFASMHPPITLTFGTREGGELPALDLTIVNDTVATALVPAFLEATSFARADITIADSAGRAAYLFEAFTYQPSWEPYATNALLVLLVLLLACRILPAYIRAGCETSPQLFEWQLEGGRDQGANGKRGPTGEPTEMV